MANLTRQQVMDLKEAYKIYRPSVNWAKLQVAQCFSMNPFHFREFLHDNHLEMWKSLQGNPSEEAMTEGQMLLDEWFANGLIDGNDGQTVLDQYYAG